MIISLLVIISAIVAVGGTLIFGAIETAKVINDSARQVAKDSKTRAIIVNQNNEDKAIYDPKDVLKSGIFEVKILEKISFKDGLENTYSTKKDYCGVKLSVKNLNNKTATLNPLNYNFKAKDNSRVVLGSFFLDNANKQYETKLYDLAPNQEVTQVIVAECEEQSKYFELTNPEIITLDGKPSKNFVFDIEKL